MEYKIGDKYKPDQPIAAIPNIRMTWGVITAMVEDENGYLIEYDCGIEKGDVRNIFTDFVDKTKECAHCHKIKSYKEFYRSSTHPTGRQSWCIECTKEYKPKTKKCSKMRQNKTYYRILCLQ